MLNDHLERPEGTGTSRDRPDSDPWEPNPELDNLLVSLPPEQKADRTQVTIPTTDWADAGALADVAPLFNGIHDLILDHVVAAIVRDRDEYSRTPLRGRHRSRLTHELTTTLPQADSHGFDQLS